jgi:hypothetical protein
VLLFSGSGALLAEYAYTEAGLAAAFAAAAAGDVVDLPAGTMTGDVTVPAGVTLRGMGAATVIDGAISAAAAAVLVDFLSYRSVATAADSLHILAAAGVRAYRVRMYGRQTGAGRLLGYLSVAGVGEEPVDVYNPSIDLDTAGGSCWAYAAVTAGGIRIHHGSAIAAGV